MEDKEYPTAIDLFSGSGGLSLGLLQAGYKVLAGADSGPQAMWTYLKNLGDSETELIFVTPKDEERWKEKGGEIGGGWISDHPNMPAVEVSFLGNIRKLDGEEILKKVGVEMGDIDLVAGGPPCPGFSYAGKRGSDGYDPRNDLIFDFLRLVGDMWPKCFMFENVPGITSLKHPERGTKGWYWNLFQQIADDLGYNFKWEKLNAADYGVPQKRKRIIGIGTRKTLLNVDQVFVDERLALPKMNGPTAWTVDI